MGPLAGIGDSISQFRNSTSIFNNLCYISTSRSYISGPIIFLLGLNIILFLFKLFSGMYGYKVGVKIIETLSEK